MSETQDSGQGSHPAVYQISVRNLVDASGRIHNPSDLFNSLQAIEGALQLSKCPGRTLLATSGTQSYGSKLKVMQWTDRHKRTYGCAAAPPNRNVTLHRLQATFSRLLH